MTDLYDHEVPAPRPLKRPKAVHNATSSKLSDRRYTVAWICALHIEMAAAQAMLDETHDGLPRGFNDNNAYKFGSIKHHNIVIACLPLGQYGTNNAAQVFTNLLRTFPDIQRALLVGIGGGVPGKADLRLGDVVVGTKVIQYDYGKVVTNGKMLRTATAKLPEFSLRAAVSSLRADHDLRSSRLPMILGEKMGSHKDYSHPPKVDSMTFCLRHLIHMRQPRQSRDPVVHYGTIASGNSVMKDAATRDATAKELDAICFEMEAAGLMEGLACLPIRGICDYADSHKAKGWQKYAAATAAAYARELLESLAPDARDIEPEMIGHWMVPFERNEAFVGREDALRRLRERIHPNAQKHACQRTVIEGLGGIGKTQIALEAVYRLHEADPSCSIFWVPAVDATMFVNAYRNIGQLLEVPGLDNDKADVNTLVKAAMSHEDVGHWLLIIDNADDPELMFGPDGLHRSLPMSLKGSIMFTTRTREITERLDVHRAGIVKTAKMGREEARNMLQTRLTEGQMRDIESTDRLLEALDYLPLAIRQASAYIHKAGISPTQYLGLCQSSDTTFVKVLSRDFEDRGRYDGIQNPIATTWLISFEQLSKENPRAGQYLQFMCFLAERDIPMSLLPFGDDMLEGVEAVGMLESYGFVVRRDDDSMDMHRLVRLATRNWLMEKTQAQRMYNEVVRRLATVFPWPEHENRGVWMRYMAHGQRVLESIETCEDERAKIHLLLHIGAAHQLQGSYREAAKMRRDGLELLERVLGKEHPDTLRCMSSLAFSLSDKGDYTEAISMIRATLVLQETVLGKEHPDTLASMSHLASVLKELGECTEAIFIHRATLALQERVLGKEHPDTLASMSRLASVLTELGECTEAMSIHRATLALKERVLGKEHPHTLHSMQNFAVALGNIGEYTEAEAIHRQTLALHERVLGKEHPHTLISMSNLAVALWNIGEYTEAEAIQRQTLALCEKVLGKEHPNTLTSMNNLAIMLQERRLHRGGGDASSNAGIAE